MGVSHAHRALMHLMSIEANLLDDLAAHIIAHLFPIASDSEDFGSEPASRPPRPPRTHMGDLSIRSTGPPQPSDPAAPSPSLRPGESIPVYDSKDVTGGFPHAYELVLNIAARWAGTTTEDVAHVVSLIDSKLASKARKDKFAATQRTREDKKAARKKWLANHGNKEGSGEDDGHNGEDGGTEDENMVDGDDE